MLRLAPLCLLTLRLAAVEPSPRVDWTTTHRAAGYAAATAHDPCYQDRAVWPGLSGKEAFTAQQWTGGRVLVWAHPGENGYPGGTRNGRTARDSADPANWLIDGKPATLDADGNLFGPQADLVLPDSETEYAVDKVPMTPGAPRQEFRHITVGRNAMLQGGGDGVGSVIHGNLWIKRLGRRQNQGGTTFAGAAHTFLRNDNDYSLHTRRHLNYARITQYFTFSKAAEASIEVLGKVECLDEFNVAGCTVIVGRDSGLHPGRNASPVITKGGRLVLMDGALFGNWINNFRNIDLEVTGTIQAGTPERPLTRDARLELCFKNHSDRQYDGPGAPEKKGKVLTYPVLPALKLHPGSALVCHSADPARARLVVTWAGEIGIEGLRPGDPATWPAARISEPIMQNEQRDRAQRQPELLQLWAFFDSLPRGIGIRFGSGTRVEGVTFDHLRAGGLMLEAPTDRASLWKDVRFGPDCHATGDALFSTVAAPATTR